jgi:hypothetical protein
MHTTADIRLRELAHRTNDSIDVRLLWRPDTNRVAIALQDDRSGESLWFEVDGADALAAFRHPYAYASTARLSQALAA